MIRDGSTRVPPRTVPTRSPPGADPARLNASSEPFAADARGTAPRRRPPRAPFAANLIALPARVGARTISLAAELLPRRIRVSRHSGAARQPEIRASRLSAAPRPAREAEIRAARLTPQPGAAAIPERPRPPRPPAPPEATSTRGRLTQLRPLVSARVLRLPPGVRSLRLPPPGPRTARVLHRVGAMRLRNKLMILVLVPVVSIGGWLLLRDSGLFSVDDVTVSGLGADALPIVSADLVGAAHRQTTTDFSVGALRAAVAPYTVIAGIRADTHFPHGLTIEVIERHPVAHLQVGHHWFLVDRHGRVITGASGTGLPTLHAAALPSGGRSRDAFVLLALRVLADAPAVLRARVVAVTLADGALTIYLHRGPKLIFGNGALPHAKWDAATAVMADPSARGASYINVEVPSRPAAQVADSATTSTSTSSGSTADAPAGAASVLTLLDPALVQPSTYTSG